MEFLKTPRGALVLALIYFVFPVDLIPDIFGPFGRIDDLAVFGLALWRVYSAGKQTATSQTPPSQPASKKGPSDPYELFQIPKTATREQIDARYKELALQYHPDRVAHLGEELRKVAHEKMIAIQAAYDTLSKRVA